MRLSFWQYIAFFSLPMLAYFALAGLIASALMVRLSPWLAVPLGLIAGAIVLAVWVAAQGGASTVIELNIASVILDTAGLFGPGDRQCAASSSVPTSSFAEPSRLSQFLPAEESTPMILYRPVGLAELKLIAEADYRAFPPRLPEQPIFYPVLNFDYAEQIARDWNTKSDSFAGFVTKFEVEEEYARQFPVQVVGGREHQELWVPAEALEEFNQRIVGRIEVVASYYGEQFEGEQLAA